MKRCSLSLFVCIFASFAFAESASFQLRAEPNEVIVVSHRGDWQVAPENSIGAFQAAIRAGVKVIETDVRLTQDGHCVLLHDATLDRTTTGRGEVARMTLEALRTLHLRDALGTTTTERIPMLREALSLAKAHGVYLYLDKAGLNNGEAISAILACAKELDALKHLIFVLDWSYEKALAVFKEDLMRVGYCPVIADNIPDLERYVETWLANATPMAFQFRFNTLASQSYKLLPKILSSPSRAFIAATWATHTADHDDRTSLLKQPDEGWGWLIQQGFTLIETNHPRALLHYLATKATD